jgi:hypothetical protein
MVVRLLLRTALNLSFGILLAGCDPCENRMLQEIVDPSNGRKAILFERSCGAFGGTSTQVSILPATAYRLIAGGNTFSADSNQGAAPDLPEGGPPVTMTWISPVELQVVYDTRMRVFQAITHVNDVTISYETQTASEDPHS